MLTKIPYGDRKEWLNIRREGMGGSDAAAILRLSDWSSPLSVYADKLGIVPEKEDTESMRQGRDLEEYVAQRFCEQTGKRVRRENFILVNDERPFMLANIDRRIVGEKAGLECKTTSVYNKTDFEGGDVPPEYYAQCQHYLAVTGWDIWYLAVLVLNRGFYVFTVRRNDSDISALITEEERFWNEHILKQVPPEPMDNDGETLRKLYPHDDAGYVPLNSLSDILATLVEKKKECKSLEKEVAQLENCVKLALGEAAEGSDDNYRVTWKTSNSTRFDSKSFNADYPELYAQYAQLSTKRTFLIKGLKPAKEAIA